VIELKVKVRGSLILDWVVKENIGKSDVWTKTIG
jgi:hypothetical protein